MKMLKSSKRTEDIDNRRVPVQPGHINMRVDFASTPVGQRVLRRIDLGVRRAERTLTGQKGIRDEAITFRTSAPHAAEYAGMTPSLFLQQAYDWGLRPDQGFCDLGSGFGGVCLAAAFYFEKVVGFELDPRLHAAAEQLRDRLKIGNVVFRKENFLAADLSEFGVVFLFQPFAEDFESLMAERFRTLRSGTMVYACVYDGTVNALFPRDLYEQLYPVREPSINDPYNVTDRLLIRI